jgi:hypothetical protein
VVTDSTCSHGFLSSECLICRTLGSQPQVHVDASRPVSAPRRGSPPPVERAAQPDVVYGPGAVDRPSHELSWYVARAALAVVAIALVAWILAGVVFALVRVVELIAVAGLAGWAGYSVGHYRGRHHPE